jgi:hypothetical protein
MRNLLMLREAEANVTDQEAARLGLTFGPTDRWMFGQWRLTVVGGTVAIQGRCAAAADWTF